MAKKAPKLVSLKKRKLDARPDTVDFRDKMFEATLVEVPPRVPLSEYQQRIVPILDQGEEGACTGFGLATVANYLLLGRKTDPDKISVSARMFYEMARRYDEWPGEKYEGSSARGAMKGWHKHGVCSDRVWPYKLKSIGTLTDPRADDASRRPLGAYYRVNHKDLVCLHSALAEVGILYATATVHEGWDNVEKNGHIPYSSSLEILGGHAFAIVAYDDEGLWIQNSWGAAWGYSGFGRITYDDWLDNGTDIWVARLGVPLKLRTAGGVARMRAAAASASDGYAFHELRPHIISIGNNGELRQSGTYSTTPTQLREILTEDFPRITENWKTRRLALYVHGGLVAEEAAIQRVADYRATLLKNEIYPLVFIWKSDLWSTIKNILQDALDQRRPATMLDKAKDFMLDRLDDAMEPLSRLLGGKSIWEEMKENAMAATVKKSGGCRQALQHLKTIAPKLPNLQIHLIGHSAGAILLGPLVQLLTAEGKIQEGPAKRSTGLGLPVASCTLWAPACTTAFFHETYLPAIERKQIEQFALFTLTDAAEQDDHCANIYHKSLLYLVSHAFETAPRIPLLRQGEPLLGMEKWAKEDGKLKSMLKREGCRWILAPNADPDGSPNASRAQHHGDFDDDATTLRATMAHILRQDEQSARFLINRSAGYLSARRSELSGLSVSTNGCRR